LFKKHDRSPTKVALADQEESLLSLVASGIGLTVISQEEVEESQHVEKIEILDYPVGKIDLTFAYLKKRETHPPLQVTLQMIQRFGLLLFSSCSGSIDG